MAKENKTWLMLLLAFFLFLYLYSQNFFQKGESQMVMQFYDENGNKVAGFGGIQLLQLISTQSSSYVTFSLKVNNSGDYPLTVMIKDASSDKISNQQFKNSFLVNKITGAEIPIAQEHVFDTAKNCASDSDCSPEERCNGDPMTCKISVRAFETKNTTLWYKNGTTSCPALQAENRTCPIYSNDTQMSNCARRTICGVSYSETVKTPGTSLSSASCASGYKFCEYIKMPPSNCHDIVFSVVVEANFVCPNKYCIYPLGTVQMGETGVFDKLFTLNETICN